MEQNENKQEISLENLSEVTGGAASLREDMECERCGAIMKGSSAVDMKYFVRYICEECGHYQDV